MNHSGATFAGAGEMRALCRAFDWSVTSLGAPEAWPVSLRTTVATMLASRHQMFLWWGPDLVQIYNDAYRPTFGEGGSHPRALGARGAEFWTEIWGLIGPQIAHVMSGGDATWNQDQRIPIERNGRMEEAWSTYSFGPAFDDDGKIGGVLVVCQETTDRVLAEAKSRALTATLAEDRARLASVLEAAPAVMAIYSGPDHIISYVNPTWHRVVGKSDALGRSVRDVFPEMIETGIFDELDRVYATGDAWRVTEMSLPIRRRPGDATTESVWNFVWMPLPGAFPVGPSGLGGDILLHAIDVTEQVTARREVERHLHESELARAQAEHAREEANAARASAEESALQFRTQADALPTLAWTARADGCPEWFNARWYEYTGTTPGDTAGSRWDTVHDPAVLPQVRERWRASVSSGAPFEMTFPLRGADGTFRSFLTRVVPVRDSGGSVVRWLGTNTDIDDEIRLRREAEAANRAKSEFLAVMSHELRTPLNAIDGYAELMEFGVHGPLTPEQRVDLARIRKSERHLLGLINGVLDFARLEAGTMRYEITDVRMDAVLATCAALIAPQALAKRQTFTSPEFDGALVVKTDAEKVQQIVLNLLTNASKFTEPGGHVGLTCTAADSEIRIVVSDTGRGIAADQITRVFDPFVQVDMHLDRTNDGVGLGLPISRDLARGMGGELSAESTVGVGSRFTLTLPRR